MLSSANGDTARSPVAYPQPGRALLPAALQPYLGDEPLKMPQSLRDETGLSGDACLKDLNADLWGQASTEAMTELGARVVSLLQGGLITRRLEGATERVFTGNVPLAAMRLSRRTRNVLFHLGLVHDGVVASIELRDLAYARQVGARALLELLQANEEAETLEARLNAEPRIGSKSDGRTPSHAVSREAKKLMRKRWASKIRHEDPRFGADLASMAPGAITPMAAAEVLPALRYEPSEARRVAGMLRRFMDRADRVGRLTLESELDELLEAFTLREHQRIALRRRFGWDGAPPGTLEDAANAIGVTRERVRQIEARFARTIKIAWTPALDRTLRLVSTMAFASLSDVQTALREAKLIERDFPIASLIATARFFGRDVPTLGVYGDMLAPADFSSLIDRVGREARRLTSAWGATTIAELTSVLGEKGTRVQEDDVRRALQVVPGNQFLDNDKNWLWIADTARNRLLNNVLKIMSVAGSIDLADLRDGVGRHHRSRGFRPPRSVLSRICEASGLYVVKNGRVFGKPGLPDWRNVLGGNERLIAETLFEHGPVMHRSDLERLVIDEGGMPRNSFWIYLGYSPILERYAPSVFGLRGAKVTAAEVSAMVSHAARSRVLRDHGWTRERQVWVVYRLSSNAVETGVLTVPAALTDVLRGRFDLITDDGTPIGSVSIDESRLWGLSPFYRRRGAEAGDHVLLTFDTNRRTTRAEIGGSDVALRFDDDDDTQVVSR